MAKLIMCKGLPGSGKSTWALEQVEQSGWVIVRVNKDEIRERLNQPWSFALEALVIRERDRLISEALEKRLTVISDDTNLAPKHEIRLRELASAYNADFEINDSFMRVPMATCIERDGHRVGKARVGEKVIKSMARQFLYKPAGPPVPYVPDISKPGAIICDLDGTIAMWKERNLRGPFEYEKAGNDDCNYPVREVVMAMSMRGYKIIFVSGREEKGRDAAYEFLKKHQIPCHAMFMRANLDHRKDSIVKSEIFDNEIRTNYNVLFVLDDRDQVVKMWRDLGLVCMQVAYGAF